MYPRLKTAEAEEYGEPQKGLLDKIVKLQGELEVLKDQEKTLQEIGRSRLSPTDPDARLMKSQKGMIPAYPEGIHTDNVQVSVDGENKMTAGDWWSPSGRRSTTSSWWYIP